MAISAGKGQPTEAVTGHARTTAAETKLAVPMTERDDETSQAVPSAAGPTPRLYQRAFDILAEQIDDGHLPPGARLTESALAAQFGISRAPTRRALEELARAGKITKAAGRGYVVAGASTGRAPALQPPNGDGVRLISAASWEAIYSKVEDQIIGRISFAAWRVNEAELARYHRVSRTVARDVVGRLQQRGLIRKDERSRWYAPALTPEHVGELYELRAVLEPVALKKAAERLPPSLLPRMRRHLEVAARRSDMLEGPTLDRLEEEMHVELLGHCGNRALMQAIEQPQSLLIAHRFLYRWTTRLFASEPFLPEHLEIVALLEVGRVEQAAQALEAHLQVSRARAHARVEAIRYGFQPENLPYLERLP